jgi:hypothetical protein
MYPTIRDILSVNSTLKKYCWMRLLSAIWGRMWPSWNNFKGMQHPKELYVKQMEVAEELNMAKAKSTKVALCC